MTQLNMNPSAIIPIDERLSLVVLAPRHAKRLFACIAANRRYLDSWLDWVKHNQSLDDTRAFIAVEMEKFAGTTAATYGIFYGGDLCGVAGFNTLDVHAARGELGYWLAEDSTGQGIMARVVKALCQEGFEQLGLKTIEIHCAIDNVASRKVAERAGARLVRRETSAALLHGEPVVHAIYVMLRD